MLERITHTPEVEASNISLTMRYHRLATLYGDYTMYIKFLISSYASYGKAMDKIFEFKSRLLTIDLNQKYASEVAMFIASQKATFLYSLLFPEKVGKDLNQTKISEYIGEDGQNTPSFLHSYYDWLNKIFSLNPNSIVGFNFEPDGACFSSNTPPHCTSDNILVLDKQYKAGISFVLANDTSHSTYIDPKTNSKELAVPAYAVRDYSLLHKLFKASIEIGSGVVDNSI
ncbi:MAG TPA: hypothetical protein VF185_03660 [Patescibacteria group bacterium]